MFKHNFHTHTHYCDGSAAPAEYVELAIESGLTSLGFSGHAPVPMDNGFAIKDDESLLEYCSEIRKLQQEYKDKIKIYLALEADYIPGITKNFSYFRNLCELDYLIGSVHLVISAEAKLWFIDGPERSIWLDGFKNAYSGDIRKAVKAYYEQVSQMVEKEQPDVVGHFDKVKMHNRGEYFQEEEDWYKDLVHDSLEVVKQKGCIVEVNTRGLYKKRSESLFPDLLVLREMKEMNIPVTISSDAHDPHEINLKLQYASSKLQEAGYKEVYIFKDESWLSIPLDTEL